VIAAKVIRLNSNVPADWIQAVRQLKTLKVAEQAPGARAISGYSW
jgi:hypothetical protein